MEKANLLTYTEKKPIKKKVTSKTTRIIPMDGLPKLDPGGASEAE